MRPPRRGNRRARTVVEARGDDDGGDGEVDLPWVTDGLRGYAQTAAAIVWVSELEGMQEWLGLSNHGQMGMVLNKIFPALLPNGKSAGKSSTSILYSASLPDRCFLLWIIHQAMSKGKAWKPGEPLAMSEKGLKKRAPKWWKRWGRSGSPCVHFEMRALRRRRNYDCGVFYANTRDTKRQKWRLRVTFRFPNADTLYTQSVATLLCFLKRGERPTPSDGTGASTSTAVACDGPCVAMHWCEHACCLHPHHIGWAAKGWDIKGWWSMKNGKARAEFLGAMLLKSWPGNTPLG